jgi:uncharacterized protein YjfI (DUF2170 family)
MSEGKASLPNESLFKLPNASYKSAMLGLSLALANQTSLMRRDKVLPDVGGVGIHNMEIAAVYIVRGSLVSSSVLSSFFLNAM